MDTSVDKSFVQKRIKEKYLLLEQLGRGGMGVVFKALLLIAEKEVALKLFLPAPGLFAPAQEQELKTRFITEAHVMAKMKHDHIMELHDFDRDNDRPFYTMDLMPMSLEKLIGTEQTTQPLPEAEVVLISQQICDALSYLHDKGVTHRDLKPGNILLTKDKVVKVSDFGISDIEWLDFSMYGESGFMTPQYCSPEQKNNQKITHRSDIYSLGVIIYQLLTGRLPSGDYIPVSSHRDGLNPFWNGILSKVLKENPDDRYQTATELSEEIQKFGSREHPTRQNMVKVPAGEFLFGREKELKDLPDFWIDQYPVTNKDYREFVESQNYPKPAFWEDAEFNADDQPVVGVSWEDANVYAQWVGKRLPTEEEWEKAARGTDGRQYPWGQSWPDKNLCNCEETIGKTSPVKQYEKNKSVYGCCDLTGNVWEWTSDAKEDDDALKIIKGGSWLSFPLQLKCSHKDYLHPIEKTTYIGFRCVEG